MFNPDLRNVLKNKTSRYSLVTAVAKRAREIAGDAQENGEILEEKPVDVTEEQLRSVIKKFEGEIFQIPPMYSAIKINGKKLYELAREGVEVERESRKVTIYHIRYFYISRCIIS